MCAVFVADKKPAQHRRDKAAKTGPEPETPGKMPFPVVEDGTQLAETIRGAAQEWKKHEKEIEDFIYLYTGSCDGNATERILELAGLERQIQ